MARLTRTQKYADLRDQLSNDREAEAKNEELSKYEDRLKSLQSIFDNKEEPKKEVEKAEVKENNIEDKKENEKLDEFDFLSSFDTGNIDKAINDLINRKISILGDIEPKNEEIVNEVKEERNVDEPLDLSKLDEISKQIENIGKKEDNDLLDNVKPIEEENLFEDIKPIEEEKIDEKPEVEINKEIDIVEEPKTEINKDVNIVEEPKETDPLVEISPVVETIENIIDELEDDNKEVTNKIEVTKEVKEEAQTSKKEEETLKVDTLDLHKLDEILKEDVNKVEEVKEDIVEEVKEIEEDVAEKTKPIEELKDEAFFEDIKPIEEIKEPEIINNEYVEGTLAEVEAYNKNDGCQTVEDISKTLIDNIRHNKEEKDAIEAEDEFSNTVSLEIDKVLNELNVDTSTVNLENVLDDEIAEPVEIKPEEYADKITDTFEHPVLTKKEEEPVEIMPLEETFKQETIDDTIPFVMEDVKEDEEVEYYDDEKPNKILNIFLIILIVILLAILGVIAYYILYAKGIIG